VPVYVSLLRAVNVGGRTIPMSDLRAVYQDLGHTDVVTYVQSGNVVSRTSTRRAPGVERAVSRALAERFGFDVEVLVRTPQQLQALLDDNPFVARRRKAPAPTTLHVTFLAHAPDAEHVRALDEREFAPDEFHVRAQAREVYVSCPNGYGRTKITNAWFERKLGVAATTRNWNTVGKLVELGR
jgi:uncharacterized protein (DUF1697 family)